MSVVLGIFTAIGIGASIAAGLAITGLALYLATQYVWDKIIGAHGMRKVCKAMEHVAASDTSAERVDETGE